MLQMHLLGVHLDKTLDYTYYVCAPVNLVQTNSDGQDVVNYKWQSLESS